MVKIKPKIIKKIQQLASQSSQEIVGIIYQDDNNNQQILEMDNISQEPENGFEMGLSVDYAKLLIADKVLAIYHSHNDDSVEPSPLDIEQQKFSCLPWLIVSSKTEEIRWLP